MVNNCPVDSRAAAVGSLEVAVHSQVEVRSRMAVIGSLVGVVMVDNSGKAADSRGAADNWAAG